MKSKILSILLLTLVILAGCNKDDGPDAPSRSLSNFSFQKRHNPSLQSDVQFNYYGQRIVGQLPYNADYKNLVAFFGAHGSSVTVNNAVQKSGITANDFTQVLTYTVTNQDGIAEDFEVDAIWFTGLPVFSIETINQEEINSVDEYVYGDVAIEGGRNFSDNSGDMKIRGRGHSTWYFHPKKPYQLKFDDKTEVLGMPADKKWIFLAEFSDKTLIRNRLAFELGHMSNLDWTPQSKYAEVFVNDEHMGVYHITQKVETGDDRVDIGENGYLLEIDVEDHLDPDDVYFHSNKFLLQVKEPELDFDSEELNYIKNYILEFENALYSENFKDPETGYKAYIEIESFVDWYLINEIAKNQDSKDYSSMYMNLVPGGKLKMGPIWDFDLGFGNVDYSECEFPTHFWVKHHAWISRMFEDPEFVQRVKERFAYFRENEDYLVEFIDKTSADLDLAQTENDNKWDLIGRYVWPNPVVFYTYQQEVDYLKDWLGRRMNWLDEAYGSL